MTLRPSWRLMVAGWLLAALAWTPAALLITSPAQLDSEDVVLALGQMLIHFAPWALSVPFFIRLSRRFPIGLGRDLPKLFLFALLALIVVPLFTAIGVTGLRILTIFAADYRPGSGGLFSGIGQATLITGLFALPTYVALVAIGQTGAYVERYRQRERLLSKARAETLRAQITPHFLFNALNAISELGYSDPAQADAAMVRMSGLLRETLERPEWVTLREEVALLADYLELHRLLLGNRLDLAIHIDPDAWDLPLPSLLLQPLVENALAHGVSRIPGGGRLELVARSSASDLELKIVNDIPGKPLPSGGAGIGLNNVRDRLTAAYGQAAGLDFHIDSGKAVATLRLPKREAKP